MKCSFVASPESVIGGHLYDTDTILEESDEMGTIDVASGCEMGDTDTTDERWDFAEYLFGCGPETLDYEMQDDDDASGAS